MHDKQVLLSFFQLEEIQNISRKKKREAPSIDEGLHLPKTYRNTKKQQNFFSPHPYKMITLSTAFFQLQNG